MYQISGVEMFGAIREVGKSTKCSAKQKIKKKSKHFPFEMRKQPDVVEAEYECICPWRTKLFREAENKKITAFPPSK